MKVIEEQQNKWKSVNICIIIITFLYNFWEKQFSSCINNKYFFIPWKFPLAVSQPKIKEEEFILQTNETNKQFFETK